MFKIEKHIQVAGGGKSNTSSFIHYWDIRFLNRIIIKLWFSRDNCPCPRDKKVDMLGLDIPFVAMRFFIPGGLKVMFHPLNPKRLYR